MNYAGMACVVLGVSTFACVKDPVVRPPEPPTASQKRHTIVPRAEHHTHVAGPVSLEPEPPPPPPVSLPPELKAVLEAREALSGSSDSSDLFTEDVLTLNSSGERWQRGRASAAELTRDYPKGTRWVPTAFAVDGGTAWIAGLSKAGDDAPFDMIFTLGLKKVGGAWRIASEQGTVMPPKLFAAPVTAEHVIAKLDEAGIEKAVLLSVAYWLGSPRRSGPGEAEKVRAENDWAIAEAAKFPQRLVVFCSMNPLKDYAIAEIERCAKQPNVKGVKLQFGNSRIDFKNAQHVEALKKFFRAANAQRMAIVAHLWNGPAYGAEDAKVALEQLFPEAPDVTIQIAHLGAAGGYAHDDAIAVYADAAEKKDPRMKNVYFDIATVVTDDQPKETIDLIARRIRQIGVDKILYGTDTYVPTRPSALQSWATTRTRLPLTDEEIRTIADNLAPYLR